MEFYALRVKKKPYYFVTSLRKNPIRVRVSSCTTKDFMHPMLWPDRAILKALKSGVPQLEAFEVVKVTLQVTPL